MHEIGIKIALCVLKVVGPLLPFVGNYLKDLIQKKLVRGSKDGPHRGRVAFVQPDKLLTDLEYLFRKGGYEDFLQIAENHKEELDSLTGWNRYVFLNRMGIALFRSNQALEAVRILGIAIAEYGVSDPLKQLMYVNRASAHILLRNATQAEMDLHHASAINPKLDLLLYNWLCLMSIKRDAAGCNKYSQMIWEEHRKQFYCAGSDLHTDAALEFFRTTEAYKTWAESCPALSTAAAALCTAIALLAGLHYFAQPVTSILLAVASGG